jgi:hypothetical protein
MLVKSMILQKTITSVMKGLIIWRGMPLQQPKFQSVMSNVKLDGNHMNTKSLIAPFRPQEFNYKLNQSSCRLRLSTPQAVKIYLRALKISI